ncbi:hypothetical protein [Siminovitchia fortis]|uniref:hypothetical protein n=1 Tax=Siminovitchia fortis TaxID=254758 RepID=UPI0011A37AF2|nr:hypothetical protein [Siminovitchia fortis]
MINQTKLVDCGACVFVYDFHHRRKAATMNFEKSPSLGALTNLKKLILTNFVRDELLTMFTLSMPISQYKNAQTRLSSFINQLSKTSGVSRINHLAVAELPSESSGSTVYLHLVTDLETHLLTRTLDEEIPEEKQDDYFSNIWGDELLIDVAYDMGVLDIFDSAYKQSITSSAYTKHPKILFRSGLRQPIVYWNGDADKVIKEQNLLSYPYHRSEEFFDGAAGWVIVNEYSRYNTSPIEDELAPYYP